MLLATAVNACVAGALDKAAVDSEVLFRLYPDTYDAHKTPQHLTWELPGKSMGSVPISSWLRNLKWLALQRLLLLYLS
jgi:hypothetical protein